jgi:hypothetical protein
MPRSLVLLFVLVFPVGAGSDDWPKWRGGTPTAPGPLWKVPVGEGQSSPVVAQGRLFELGRPTRRSVPGSCAGP